MTASADHITRNSADAPSARRPVSRIIPVLGVGAILDAGPIEWIVTDVFVTGGLFALTGKSGLGKTFMGIDLALHMVAGRMSWLGFGLKPGNVVYVSAEGGRAGFNLRLRCWCEHHGVDPRSLEGKLFLTPVSVDLVDPDGAAALIAAIRARSANPALVVIDTFARCMGRGDENSARDVGQFVASCDSIRQQLGCAVLVVNHTGKDGNGTRGSSALDGALDAQLLIKRSKSGGISVSAGKLKDAEPFQPIQFKLQRVELSTAMGDAPQSSCVLLPDDDQAVSLRAGDQAGTRCRELCSALREIGGAAGCATSELKKKLGWPKSSFHEVLNLTIDRGDVEVLNDERPQRVRAAGSPQASSKSEVRRSPTRSARTSSPKSGRLPAPLGRETGRRRKSSQENGESRGGRK